jgi:internalin A
VNHSRFSWACGASLLIVNGCGGRSARSAPENASGSAGLAASGSSTAGTGSGGANTAGSGGTIAPSSAGAPASEQGGSASGAAGDVSPVGRGGSGGAAADPCRGPLSFADPDVEANLRGLIGKPAEPMYAIDFARVTDLSGMFTIFGSGDQRPCAASFDCPVPEPPVMDSWVTSVGGLECLPDVEKIVFDAWYVADFSPLTAMSQLTTLDLGWAPELSRLAPLPQLRELSVVYGHGGLQGLSAVPNLTSFSGRFSNLSARDALAPLQSLRRLRNLNLSGSKITNIEALAGLHELSTIDLSDNDIADFSPLLDIPGLGPDSEVNVSDNPGNCNDPAIAPLLARKVRVHPCVE